MRLKKMGADPCPVCSSSNSSRIRGYRGGSTVFKGCYLANCNVCDLVYTSPFPSDSALEDYNSRYFKEAHGGKSNTFDAVAFFSALAQIRIRHISDYLFAYSLTPARIFEFGPGDGYFAKHWLSLHKNNIYSVYETDVSCHDNLREAGVRICTDSSLIGLEGQYDLVVMSHVLEHTSRPMEFIGHAVKLLRKGGVLFVEVPCKDYIYKTVDEPHLLFFDKSSMNKLLAGFNFSRTAFSYHGKVIRPPEKETITAQIIRAIRHRMIAHGIHYPYSRKRPGLDFIDSPVERAIVSPFRAHIEQSEPSWWLRVLATKS